MNILIKLMSIVSLVIAPTLATISGETATKGKGSPAIKEVSIIKTGDEGTMTVTTTVDKEKMNTATNKLIDALATDNLLNKDNYNVAVTKGKIAVNGTALQQEASAKYQSLINDLGGADIELKNSQQ